MFSRKETMRQIIQRILSTNVTQSKEVITSEANLREIKEVLRETVMVPDKKSTEELPELVQYMRTLYDCGLDRAARHKRQMKETIMPDVKIRALPQKYKKEDK